MLGKLLHALKSEKSSKGAHNATQSKQQQPQSGTAATPLAALSLFQIDPSVASHQQVIVAESLPKIRYFVLESLPELYLQVLACPLSVFHSLPHSQRQVKQISLLELPMPEYLCFLHPLLAQQLPSHNHLLINHYPPGIGIMPHRDGPAYLPKVLVLSLHSHAVISFQPTTSGSPCLRLLLQPNSIHIFQHQAYTTHMHGIDNYQIDSVLLSYDPVQDRVTDCNVGNYKQLACRGWLEACMRAGEAEVEQGDLRLLRLQGNAEYTHKLENSKVDIGQYLQQLQATPGKHTYQVKILQLLIALETAQQAQATLLSQHTHLSAQCESLQGRCNGLEAALAQKQNQLISMQEQIERVQDERTEFEFDCKALRREAEEARERHEGELADCRARWAEAEAQERDLRGKLEEERVLREQEKGRVARLEAQMEKLIQQSKQKDVNAQKQKISIEESCRLQLKKQQQSYNSLLQSSQFQLSAQQNQLTLAHSQQLAQLQDQIAQSVLAQQQQKLAMTKAMQKLQSRLKLAEAQHAQTNEQRAHLEQLQEANQRELKNREKDLKAARKDNAEMRDRIAELEEQVRQLASQYAGAEAKRKQLAREANQLRKELDSRNEEYLSENEQIQKQKENIRELREEIRKLKQTLQLAVVEKKELESSLYKMNVSQESSRKQIQELQIKIQYIEAANVKLNQKVILAEAQKQSVLKTIVTQKDLLEKQNLRLLQMLELKQNTIRAIINNSDDLTESTLAEFTGDIRTKQVWMSLSKQNLKQPISRRLAIDRHLLL